MWPKTPDLNCATVGKFAELPQPLQNIKMLEAIQIQTRRTGNSSVIIIYNLKLKRTVSVRPYVRTSVRHTFYW